MEADLPWFLTEALNRLADASGALWRQAPASLQMIRAAMSVSAGMAITTRPRWNRAVRRLLKSSWPSFTSYCPTQNPAVRYPLWRQPATPTGAPCVLTAVSTPSALSDPCPASRALSTQTPVPSSTQINQRSGPLVVVCDNSISPRNAMGVVSDYLAARQLRSSEVPRVSRRLLGLSQAALRLSS